MIKLRIWDKETPMVYANGYEASPEQVMTDFPWSKHSTGFSDHYGDSPMIIGFYPLLQFRHLKNIDANLSDKEALAEIEWIMNEPEQVHIASPEERIAAALEFQNILSM